MKKLFEDIINQYFDDMWVILPYNVLALFLLFMFFFSIGASKVLLAALCGYSAICIFLLIRPGVKGELMRVLLDLNIVVWFIIISVILISNLLGYNIF